MSEDKEQQVIYTVPPSVNGKTWAEVEKKRLEVQKYQIDKVDAIVRDIAKIAKEYYGRKTMNITLISFIMIGGIAFAAGLLTFIGRLSGETFAFLAGSIVGYICLLYTSPSPRDLSTSRMPSSA